MALVHVHVFFVSNPVNANLSGRDTSKSPEEVSFLSSLSVLCPWRMQCLSEDGPRRIYIYLKGTQSSFKSWQIGWLICISSWVSVLSITVSEVPAKIEEVYSISFLTSHISLVMKKDIMISRLSLLVILIYEFCSDNN